MRAMTSRFLLTLAAVVLVVAAFVPAAHAAAPAPAPTAQAAPAAQPAVSGTCSASPLAALGLPTPVPEAIAPHCCTQQDRDACTATCKAQFPGCKGQIGCRAGECVCTCVCP